VEIIIRVVNLIRFSYTTGASSSTLAFMDRKVRFVNMLEKMWAFFKQMRTAN